MIVETALKVAGPGSVLAARPTGVAHVYTGPLTPSQRFIPRAAAVVCRARTRRLHVVRLPHGWSSLHPEASFGLPRLCARCSVCLARRRTQTSSVSSPTGQTEQHPQLRTRGDYLRVFAGLTPADLWVAGWAADTRAEVDAVAFLSLALFGHAVCTRPVVLPSGRRVGSLHDMVTARRNEDLDQPLVELAHIADAAAVTAQSIRQQRVEEARQIREARRAPRHTNRPTTTTGAPL